MKRTFLTLLSAALPAFTAHAEKLVLTGGTAINPADGKIIQNAVITIDGDTIQGIGSGDKPSPDAKAIDCKGKFILPGYIDSHVHFFQSADLFTRPDVIDLTKVR